MEQPSSQVSENIPTRFLPLASIIELYLKSRDFPNLLFDFAPPTMPQHSQIRLQTLIERPFLSVLELTFAAAYLPPEQKIILLGKTISRLDVLKFFAQLAWESKLIPNDKYLELSSKLEEIGRMLGGWRKGLLIKTLPKNIGRER